jgi:hypothetical protein
MQFHVREDNYGNVDVKLGYKTKQKLRKLRNGVVFGLAIFATHVAIEKRKNKNTDEQ